MKKPCRPKEKDPGVLKFSQPHLKQIGQKITDSMHEISGRDITPGVTELAKDIGQSVPRFNIIKGTSLSDGFKGSRRKL